MSLIKILRSNASYCVAPLRVSVLFILRVSPKAKASAFQSLHLLLTLNTEYGGQRRIVLAIINNNPSIPPCLLTSLSSAFRRRPQRQRPLLTDVVVLDFISRRDAEAQRLKPQKFFRVISYHFVIPNSPQKISAPLFLHFLRVSPEARAIATNHYIRVPVKLEQIYRNNHCVIYSFAERALIFNFNY